MWEWFKSLFRRPPAPVIPDPAPTANLQPYPDPPAPKRHGYICQINKVHPASIKIMGGNYATWINSRHFPDLRDQKPEIYLYTVNEASFPVENGILGRIMIPGKRKNEPYRFIFSLPKTIVYPKNLGLSSDEFDTVCVDGLTVAQDIINPESLQGLKGMSQGRDLSQKGVFYSRSNPPKESEVKAAHAALRAHYKEFIWRCIISGTAAFTPETKKEIDIALEHLPQLRKYFDQPFKA
jgi:hypothetical protein